MMISRKISSNKNRISLIKFAVFLIIFIIFLFTINAFANPIKSFFVFASQPIQKNLWNTSSYFSSLLNPFLNVNSLKQENETLKKENYQLLTQLLFERSNNEELDSKNSISVIQEEQNFNLISTNIIGLSKKDTLSIDKGSNTGITVEMPVLDKNGILVGKVMNVYNNFSEVMLASNNNSNINVRVVQNDPLLPEIDGILKGSSLSNSYLDMVPVNKPLSVGDVLATSHIDNNYPKNILVAKIKSIEKDDQKPFQIADLELLFDITKSENLFVISNYKKQ